MKVKYVVPCNCGTALCWVDSVWHGFGMQPKFLSIFCDWHDWFMVKDLVHYMSEPKKCRNFALILDRIKLPKFCFKLLERLPVRPGAEIYRGYFGAND